MTDLEELADIEAVKGVMAKFARFGDSQNWTEFRRRFTDDLVYSAEAGPRPNPEAPQAISIEGLDIFMSGMAALLTGAHSCHRMYLPEIAVTGPDIVRKLTYGSGATVIA